MMNEHKKKMVAPIIITVLVVIYFILYFGVLIALIDNAVVRILLAIVPALLGVTMVGVCVQRIKEIKGGEEDDLSKY